jgi:hypothetical protein
VKNCQERAVGARPGKASWDATPASRRKASSSPFIKTEILEKGSSRTFFNLIEGPERDFQRKSRRRFSFLTAFSGYLLSSVQWFFLRTAPSSTGSVHVKNGPYV